jgi:hypothetical protein
MRGPPQFWVHECVGQGGGDTPLPTYAVFNTEIDIFRKTAYLKGKSSPIFLGIIFFLVNFFD